MAAKKPNEPTPESVSDPTPESAPTPPAPLASSAPAAPQRHGPPVWLWILLTAVAAVSIYFAGIATAIGIAVVDRHLAGPDQQRSQQLDGRFGSPADGTTPERVGPGTGGERPGPGSGERPTS